MNSKMRKMVVLFCSTTALCMPHAACAQSDELSGSLSQLYNVAQQHNATLQRCQAAINEAQAAIETARMSKLPDITGQASVSYIGNARLWNRQFGESTGAPMPHYGNNFLLRAEQVLYTGGAIKGGIELAQQNARMQQLSAQNEEQRVRYMLTSLYLQLHSLRNQQQVYNTHISLAEQQIELMKKRRQQGVSLRNDVTRYELQLQQLKLALATVTDQQSIWIKQLYTALGTDSLQFQALGDEAFAERTILAKGEDEWQQLAMKQHLELQQSQLAISMSQTKERITRAERLPKIAVIAEDHLDGPITIEVPPINKNLNYWYVGLGVSYNFSSLFKTKRKMRQAQLATTLAQSELVDLQQKVGDAVHTAYVNLQTARTQLLSHQKSVQLAAENYEVVSKRYENGLALVTDLTDAANVRLESELSLANARINLVFCYYSLKYAAHLL